MTFQLERYILMVPGNWLIILSKPFKSSIHPTEVMTFSLRFSKATQAVF